MHKTKKWWLLLVAALLPLSAHAQRTDGLRTDQFRAAGRGSTINLINTGISFHQLTWHVVTTAAVCTVELDTSADGVTWAASAIVAQNCSTDGASAVVNFTANYVSINVTALTVTGTNYVAVTWTGWVSNPVSGGGVTSVTASSPITSSGGATPNIACSTCTTGSGASPEVAFWSSASALTGDPTFTFGSGRLGIANASTATAKGRVSVIGTGQDNCDGFGTNCLYYANVQSAASNPFLASNKTATAGNYFTFIQENNGQSDWVGTPNGVIFSSISLEPTGSILMSPVTATQVVEIAGGLNAHTAGSGGMAITNTGSGGTFFADTSSAGMNISEAGTGKVFIRSTALSTGTGIDIENDSVNGTVELNNVSGNGGIALLDSNSGGAGITLDSTGTGSGIFLDPSGSPINSGGSILSTGTSATITGTGACASITTKLGGSFAGTFKCTGASGASTITIAPGNTAANGWTCNVYDETTRADNPGQTAHTTAHCVVTSTTTAQNDVFSWSAIGY